MNPFAQASGIETITAAPTASADPKFAGKPFTSGFLSTELSFTQAYGYFEVRAKMPQGPGAWPAFYLLGPHTSQTTGTQVIDELDIFEIYTADPNTLWATSHYQGSNDYAAIQIGSTAGFRNYGLLWTPTHIAWYVDNQLVRSIPNPGYAAPMFAILCLAVGGYGQNPSSPMPTSASAAFDLDYLHVYQLPQ